MTERRVPEPTGPHYETTTSRFNLLDRVRWSAVVAGLAAALASMVVLSVLGLAIGLTAYDVGERTRPFQIGSGIWAIISMIVSFFIGGWVASRTAVATGDNGMLNGTMVWAAAIPLMLFLFAGGLTSVMGTAAGTPTGERVIRAATQMPGAEQTPGEQQAPAPSATDVQQTKRTASAAAWWTLVSLLLGLGAAATGGAAGQRREHHDRGTTSTRPSTTTMP
ncbi:MAG TPA: hypothetical protein VHP11_03485 [Tepidisphaeraceae bacterium]|nr:hypothetical protein [Tepidisphaeraceae bacterium]